MGSARREVLLLVLTHVLAFAVPVLPLVPVIRKIARGAPGIQAMIAESYSGKVAGLEVAVGDDRAAVAGLRRHVDRLMVVRAQLVARGGQALDLSLLDGSVCFALAEIAFLSGSEERDARIAEAAACIQRQSTNHSAMDARRVLDLGALHVTSERGSE
jgi:hypothetical protein